MTKNLFGSISELETIVGRREKILLVTGEKSFSSSGAENSLAPLFAGKNQITQISYSGKALPLEDIGKIYSEIKESNFELIIGVGGGTVIDLSKILSLLFSNKCDRTGDVLENRLENSIPMIFIPTTCGTGSEATHFAVVYKNKKKYSVADPTLLPEAVILVPELLINLPEPIRNATTLDALSQSIESIWALSANADSYEYAKSSIRFILDAFSEESLLKKLELLLRGSYFSGKAINISKTTGSHAISYPLTAYFGISHGVAVFISLPGLARRNYNVDVERRNLYKNLFQLFGTSSIEEFSSKLEKIAENLNISLKLSSYGIDKSDLSFIAKAAVANGRMGNNPGSISEDEIIDILSSTY